MALKENIKKNKIVKNLIANFDGLKV